MHNLLLILFNIITTCNYDIYVVILFLLWMYNQPKNFFEKKKTEIIQNCFFCIIYNFHDNAKLSCWLYCNIFLEQKVDTMGKVNFYDRDWWNIMNKLILCKIYDCYDGSTFYIDNTLKCIVVNQINLTIMINMRWYYGC